MRNIRFVIAALILAFAVNVTACTSPVAVYDCPPEAGPDTCH